VTAEDTARLLVRCPDRPGIVAAVSGFLHAQGANIHQSDQYSTDPEGGTFFLRQVFYLRGLSGALEELARGFGAEVAQRFGMNWTLHDASVPKRVALMVSREDHCLADLLWRWRRGELDVDIPLVISNHRDFAEDVARFEVPFQHIPVTRETKPAAERAQLDLLRGEVDLVVLARYMQILSGDFLDRIGVPVINIHHSFLPAFAGPVPGCAASPCGG
jgi:formyltetrahydrofolate deformylase